MDYNAAKRMITNGEGLYNNALISLVRNINDNIDSNNVTQGILNIKKLTHLEDKDVIKLWNELTTNPAEEHIDKIKQSEEYKNTLYCLQKGIITNEHLSPERISYLKNQLKRDIEYYDIKDGTLMIRNLVNCSDEIARTIFIDLMDIRSQEKEQERQSQEQYVPKCPTCGSPDIQKISGTKRWVTTGLFGVASGDLGKTMVCKNCGYKW